MNAFDVFSKMLEEDDKALTITPLDNISNLQKVKAGTEVTIGVGGNVVGAIFDGKFVGGLVLCDKDRFNAVKAEMESKRSA